MLTKKVLDTIKRENLVQTGDRILVALSGGADSMTLLHVLKSLQKELGIKVFSAHLNHQIRGVEAHSDALFSYRASREMDIRCFLSSVNVPDLAMDKKLTIEEAARFARYNMLFELMKKLRCNKIATAHNLDDQAETLIMRILRGTGLNGLKGIEYKRADGVIRPLMDIKRYEIEEYCRLNDIHYITDNTNLENSYTRNKIRLELLPFIEEHFACNIKEILSRMSNGIREDSRYLEENASKSFDELHQKIEDYAIKFELDGLDNLPDTIIKRMLKLAYAELLGSAEGLEYIHLDDALKIIKNPKSELMTNFPKGITVEKKGYNLYVTEKPIVDEDIDFEYEINLNGTTEIPELALQIDARTMSREKCKLLSSSSNIKAFDIDKINGKLVVRNRRVGDKIKPLGFSGTKKVKDIFIDKKIPQQNRNRIPIFADDNKVIWILGHDISDESKIGEGTKKVVRLTVKPMAKKENQEEKNLEKNF